MLRIDLDPSCFPPSIMCILSPYCVVFIHKTKPYCVGIILLNAIISLLVLYSNAFSSLSDIYTHLYQWGWGVITEAIFGNYDVYSFQKGNIVIGNQNQNCSED